MPLQTFIYGLAVNIPHGHIRPKKFMIPNLHRLIAHTEELLTSVDPGFESSGEGPTGYEVF